jgi:hypothetical protein
MLAEPVTGGLTEQLRVQPSTEEGDHVTTTWRPRDSLFEFQNQIFFEFFIRVSSFSNIKPSEVRGSIIYLFLNNVD